MGITECGIQEILRFSKASCGRDWALGDKNKTKIK